MALRGTPEEYYNYGAVPRVQAEVVPVTAPQYIYPTQEDNSFKWLIAGAVLLGFFAVIAIVATKK